MSIIRFLRILFISSLTIGVDYAFCQTLNIGFETEPVCQVLKEKRNGMIVKTFLPTEDDNITKLVDEKEVIWESRDPRKLLGFLRLFTLDNKHLLAYMSLNSIVGGRTRYLQKLGDSWIEIGNGAFRIVYRRIWRERKIDIARPPDLQVFTLTKHKLGGLPARIISAHRNFVVTDVEDDFFKIWTKETPMETCTSAIVHGHKGEPKLVSLHIKDLFTHKERYYAKTQQGWEQTTKTTFYNTLEKLDEEEELSKSSK